MVMVVEHLAIDNLIQIVVEDVDNCNDLVAVGNYIDLVDSVVVDIHIDSVVDNYTHIDLAADNYIHIDSAVDNYIQNDSAVDNIDIAVVDIVPRVQKLILDYCLSSVVVVYRLLNRLINIIIVWEL